MANKKHFKYYLLTFSLFAPAVALCIYYYHHFISPKEIRVIAAKDSNFKVAASKTRKLLPNGMLYISDIGKICNDNNVQLLDHYEKPKKIPLIQSDNLLYGLITIQDIKILYTSENYVLREKIDKLEKGAYIIELGIFFGIDEASKYWDKLKTAGGSKVQNIRVSCKQELYDNKTYIKLIIPNLKNFNEAQKSCKIIREYSDTCLIKTKSSD